MKIIEHSVHQPISVVVGVLFSILAGIISMRVVAVEMAPQVEDTVVAVDTFWENASPQEIESEVIDPQEEKLQSLSSLRSITSISSPGTGQIRLEFLPGIDKNIALRDVSDKLREVPSYPLGVDEPVIQASDPESQDYIAWYILTTEDQSYDVRKLQSFADDQIKPILERVPGISEVNALGGIEREVQIKIDPERIAQYGITLSEVVAKLRESNTNASAGSLPVGKLDIRLRAIGRFTSPEDVNRLVLRNHPDHGPVRLADVATVVEDFKEPQTFVRTKGRRAIAFNFQREPGSNVLGVMADLKATIDNLASPGGLLATETQRIGLQSPLTFTMAYDATTYVSQALEQVQKNIFIGGGLAIVVSLLFLRSLRSLGIIAISIPVSMLGSIVLMVSLGRTVNVMSLAGIAFAVGMVVDNSIVVLENIYRHLEMGKKKFKAALDGTKEVAGAVLASSLTTLIVFIPILLITDQVGQLFRDISLAIMTSVAFSYIVAITVIPSAGARMLNHKRYEDRSEQQKADTVYTLGLKAIMSNVLIKLVIVLVFAFGSIIGAQKLMPEMDYLPKGNRNVTFGLMLPPPGLNLDQLETMGKRVEDVVRPYWENRPDRKPVYDRDNDRMVTPTPLTNYFLVSTGGIMFHGCISSDDQKAIDNVALLQNATSMEVLPGTYAFAFQFPLFRLGGSTGSAVKINLTGRDLDQVSGAAGALFGALMGQYGPTSVRPDPGNFNLKVQELQLQIREDEMMKAGLRRTDVITAMQAAGDGVFLGEYEFQGDLVDLKLWTHGSREESAILDLGQVPVSTPDGRIMHLDQLAEIIWTDAAEKIKRVGRRRAVTLEFTAPTGMPLEQAVNELEGLIAGLRQGGAIPPNVNTLLEGSADKLSVIRKALLGDQTISGLVSSSMFTSFVAVYLLMCILFQSWAKPLVIMFTVPLATFGGFLGLFLVHKWSLSDPYLPIQNLDVLTLLGFVILSGVVVNNAILIVAQADILLKKGQLSVNEAIAQASRSRVRPIFMSLLTSVGGMLPLILNPGAGSELYRGLGAVVVGGMLLSTLFTLLLIPVLLSLFENLRMGMSSLWKPASVALVLVLLTACESTTPNLSEEISNDLPENYLDTTTRALPGEPWWKGFEDPTIEPLLKWALRDQVSLKALEKRVEESIALSGIPRSQHFPQISATASATRERIPAFNLPTRDNFNAALRSNWTLDWLGRLRDEQKRSSTQVEERQQQHLQHRIDLVSHILSSYLNFRHGVVEEGLLERRYRLIQDLLDLQETLYSKGLIDAGVVDETRSSQLEAHAQLISQRSVNDGHQLQLEKWVGARPGDLKELLAVKVDLKAPKTLALGQPADLLERRPDLRIARARILSEAAGLSISRKEIFPHLSLNGEVGYNSSEIDDWFRSARSGFSFGPSLSWRIFEFGRIDSEKKAALARLQAAVFDWRRTLRDAVVEVESLSRSRQSNTEIRDLSVRELEIRLRDLERKEVLVKHDQIETSLWIEAKLKVVFALERLQESRRQLHLTELNLYRSLGG